MDLPVRDVELIFGYESPTRFYYVHLAGITNAVHNGIFLVADADRRRLDQPDSVPQMKDQAWHHVRLERDPASGRIEIFMDGSTTPVLKQPTPRSPPAGSGLVPSTRPASSAISWSPGGRSDRNFGARDSGLGIRDSCLPREARNQT